MQFYLRTLMVIIHRLVRILDMFTVGLIFTSVFVHYHLFVFISRITYNEVIIDSSFICLCVYSTSETTG